MRFSNIMERSQPSFQSSERTDRRRISFPASLWCHAAMSTKVFGVFLLFLAVQSLCDAATIPPLKLDKLLDKNALNKNILDKNLLDKNLLDKNLLDKNLLDKNLLDKNLLDKNLLDKNLLGKNLLDKNLLGKNLLNSSYFDPKTGLGLKGALEESSKSPLGQLVFRGLGCDCQKLVCNCCAGINLLLLKDDQKFCTKIELAPEEFALKTALSLNDKQLLATGLTGKNPPPFCVPLPYLSSVTVCVRVYDLGIVGNNLRGCVDLETQVIQAPVLVLHFNCLSMGLDGISLSAPGSTDNIMQLQANPQNILQEIYDHVNFEPEDQQNNSNDSSSSSSEEAQVGQLKL